MTGEDNFVTMQLNSEDPEKPLTYDSCMAILKKYWGDEVVAEVEGSLRAFKDGSGIVFDVKNKDADMFIGCFELLQEKNSRLNFLAAQCESLPDLAPPGTTGEGGGYGRGKSGGDDDDDY